MIYAYHGEECGTEFTVRATLAERERGLTPHCPACGSREVGQDFASVGVVRSAGGSARVPFCGPGPGAGCC
jgi:predicted nucleic acid-binding Zn ribbon protein